MKKHLITFIFGTRPEAIKLGPIVLAFQKSKKFKVRIILTGQHNEMLYQVMKVFNLNESKNIKVMKHSQTLNYITSTILEGLKEEFNQFLPDMIIIQGDTTSAMTAALAAFYEKIPVAHVEAGLRTDNLYEPYPEEANRRIISQITSIHFAPTNLAKSNLERSSVMGKIFVTGNSVIDSLILVSKMDNKASNKIHNLDLNRNKIILATIHRRENIGENLKSIAEGFIKILEKNDNFYLFVPMHKNKLVRDPLKKMLKDHPRIILSEPLDYLELVSILKDCSFLLTDSGGLQEEAPSFGKPVLILRETTERPEGLIAGTSKLIGTKADDIFKAANNLINDKDNYLSMSKAKNPFGDGKTSERILEECIKYLNSK